MLLDLVIEISKYLKDKDILNLRLACRYFNRIEFELTSYYIMKEVFDFSLIRKVILYD